MKDKEAYATIRRKTPYGYEYLSIAPEDYRLMATNDARWGNAIKFYHLQAAVNMLNYFESSGCLSRSKLDCDRWEVGLVYLEKEGGVK